MNHGMRTAKPRLQRRPTAGLALTWSRWMAGPCVLLSIRAVAFAQHASCCFATVGSGEQSGGDWNRRANSPLLLDACASTKVSGF